MSFLITSEVFPTVCRLTACAFSFIPGRIFLIFYSYVMHVGAEQIPWISPLCMGSLALGSAIGALALTRVSILSAQKIELAQSFQKNPFY